MEKILEAAKLLYELTESKVITGSSLIAGGAVRDTLLGKDVRDVDIYIDFSKQPYAIEILNNSSDVQSCKVLGGEISIEGSHVDKPTWVAYLTMTTGTQIELIGVNGNRYDAIKAFDIGLCMVYIDTLDFSLVETEEYKRDRDLKTLTLYPSRLSSTSISRSIKTHIPKLLKKYPDFKLEIDYE